MNLTTFTNLHWQNLQLCRVRVLTRTGNEHVGVLEVFPAQGGGCDLSIQEVGSDMCFLTKSTDVVELRVLESN